MPKPQVFKVVNRLAKVIGGPEAPSQEELISKAESNVAAMGDTLRAHVRAQVAEILKYSGQGEDVLFAEAKTLGDAALSVAEVAGAADMVAIGEVARGLSAMVAGLSTGVWHSDALLVHVRSLALVSAQGAPTAQDAVVLERLAAMRKTIGVVE